MWKKTIFSIIKKVYIELFSPVILKKKEKMVCISYLPEPFRKRENHEYLNKHQNRREALILGNVFEELGWGYQVVRFDKLFFKKAGFQMVFGLEPNFLHIIEKNPLAIKIYYATGSYYQHQNRMIIQRTDAFNLKHHSHLSYQRLVAPHVSCEVADYIFQIGSSKTLNTYPEELREKIRIIHQTCHSFTNYKVENKRLHYRRNHFIWMGSNGSILKGLDLIIDFFQNKENLILHIVGNIDADFYELYKNIIENTPNMHYYGFIDMDDPLLLKIAEQCTGIIFPSCSEGLPGTVINMMKLGLIPVVSKWCSFDEIDKLGYEIQDLSVEGIKEAIDWFDSLSDEEIENLFIANYSYSNQMYNYEQFEKDMMYNLRFVLAKSGC